MTSNHWIPKRSDAKYSIGLEVYFSSDLVASPVASAVQGGFILTAPPISIFAVAESNVCRLILTFDPLPVRSSRFIVRMLFTICRASLRYHFQAEAWTTNLLSMKPSITTNFNHSARCLFVVHDSSWRMLSTIYRASLRYHFQAEAWTTNLLSLKTSITTNFNHSVLLPSWLPSASGFGLASHTRNKPQKRLWS